MMRAGTIAGVMVGAANELVGLVPMPAACQRRADVVRDYADSLGIVGRVDCDPAILARRTVWDAPAAFEFPRPVMHDAADLAAIYPAVSSAVWHAAAGATILGPGCDCGTPAGHRDDLARLARLVADSFKKVTS